MNWIHKINEFIVNLLSGRDKKKLIENSIIIIVIGIIIIIAGSTFFGGKKEHSEIPPKADMEGIEAVNKTITQDAKDDIAREIERVLSEIDGAGKVTVMITYNSGREIVPAQDLKKTNSDTDERDSGGGTRKISQNDYESNIVFEDSQGGIKKPIILKELSPEVKGVIVVAEGAGDAVVRENLVRAVQVLMDVPIHRIQVFKKGK